MRSASLVTLLAVLTLPSVGHTQTRPLTLSFGAGPSFNDHRNTSLGAQGFSAFVRVSSQRLPLLLDVSYISVPKSPIAFVAYPCPSFAPTCGGSGGFTGPVSALTLSPAVQTIERNSWSAMQYRLGPSVSWLPERQQGTDAAALGARVGASFLLRFRDGPGLMISADYLRMFRGGEAPQWFVPVTLGLQF